MRQEVFEIYLRLYFDPNATVPLRDEDLVEDPSSGKYYDADIKEFVPYRTSTAKQVRIVTTFEQRCMRLALEIWETFDKGMKNHA